MRRVAVINQKGGVGKTTTVVNHGAALARFGKRVLLVDLDPQANLSLHLNCQPERGEGKSITNLLLDDTPIEELIVETRVHNLWVVPADTALAGAEQMLADRIGRETILREAFDALGDPLRFDYLLVDCPPSLGVLSANALVAADEVLIPVQAEFFALQGTSKLMEVIDLVRRRLNPGLDVCSVLPCKVDLRTKLAEEVLEEIERGFGERLAENLIRMNVKLAEAPSFGRTIFEHAPESNGAIDHEAYAREFLAAHGEVGELVVIATETDAPEPVDESEAAPPETDASADAAPPETDSPADDEPATETATTEEAVATAPATDTPADDEPATEAATTEEAVATAPATDTPADDEPATETATTEETAAVPAETAETRASDPAREPAEAKTAAEPPATQASGGTAKDGAESPSAESQVVAKPDTDGEPEAVPADEPPAAAESPTPSTRESREHVSEAAVDGPPPEAASECAG